MDTLPRFDPASWIGRYIAASRALRDGHVIGPRVRASAENEINVLCLWARAEVAAYDQGEGQ